MPGSGRSSRGARGIRRDVRRTASVDIPNDILMRAGANVEDLRLAIAIQLYADNRIDHADACRIAEMAPTQFNRELAGRGIGIHQYPAPEAAVARRAAS